MEDTRLSKLPPVKQRRHESAAVSFCDPVQSTGLPEQTMSHLPVELPEIKSRINTGLLFTRYCQKLHEKQGECMEARK